MKLQENAGKFFVYLPAKIIKAMEWKKGDEIELLIKGKDKLEIRKK